MNGLRKRAYAALGGCVAVIITLMALFTGCRTGNGQTEVSHRERDAGPAAAAAGVTGAERVSADPRAEAASGETAPLRLGLKLVGGSHDRGDPYVIGGPIAVEVVLLNWGDSPLVVATLNPLLPALELMVTGIEGAVPEPDGLYRDGDIGLTRDELRTLAPGESSSYLIDATMCFAVNAPGRFALSARYWTRQGQGERLGVAIAVADAASHECPVNVIAAPRGQAPEVYSEIEEAKHLHRKFSWENARRAYEDALEATTVEPARTYIRLYLACLDERDDEYDKAEAAYREIIANSSGTACAELAGHCLSRLLAARQTEGLRPRRPRLP